LSKKLNGPVGTKNFDVDHDMPNYFNEVEKVIKFANTNFVVDEQFIETFLHALPVTIGGGRCTRQKWPCLFLMEVCQSAKNISSKNLVRRCPPE